ncbi:MAG: glycosyltransferase, partial [Marinirhabdus sp.]|nr:glycosyltransferase [Marinirhabdus sp.]
MIVGCSIIFALYVVLIGLLFYGNRKVPTFNSERSVDTIKFSIIVVFRNEAKNLPKLIRSLQKLNYPHPHFEVLFVNDHSTDTSEALIQQAMANSTLPCRLLHNDAVVQSPKKEGITKAISQS